MIAAVDTVSARKSEPSRAAVQDYQDKGTITTIVQRSFAARISKSAGA